MGVGKRNIITMVDDGGGTLHARDYLNRYRQVLQLEKKRHKIDMVEESLSHFNGQSNSYYSLEYRDYLIARSKVEKMMDSFYRQEKWHGWRFRLYCNRKSSEARLLNQIEDYYMYDANCYGDWSCRDQLKGCDPTPTVGMLKLISKRFCRQISNF